MRQWACSINKKNSHQFTPKPDVDPELEKRRALAAKGIQVIGGM